MYNVFLAKHYLQMILCKKKQGASTFQNDKVKLVGWFGLFCLFVLFHLNGSKMFMKQRKIIMKT